MGVKGNLKPRFFPDSSCHMPQHTKVYNITYHDYDRSLYVKVYGCNLRCIYCVNKKSIYPMCLPGNVLKTLDGRPVTCLTLHGFNSVIKDLLRKHDVSNAILGGGEPLMHRSTVAVIRALKDFGLSLRLLTNGCYLGKYIQDLKASGFGVDDRVVVSIKAMDERKHEYITGAGNSVILRNVVEAYRRGLNIVIETVYVPGLLTPREIEELALWVRSNLSGDTQLIIDPYVPIPQLKFRRPTPEEVAEVVRVASKHLRQVICRLPAQGRERGGWIYSGEERITWSPHVLGNVYLVYPIPKEVGSRVWVKA